MASMRRTCSSFSGTSRPCMSPPRHFTAAAASTPSGAPPMPRIMSMAPVSMATVRAGATSPSVMSLTLAPRALQACLMCSWRSRSRRQTVISLTSLPRAAATFLRFSSTVLSMSMAPLARGPTMILSMYISGAWSRPPASATAITAMAPGWFFAVRLVPSSGSTAMSTSVPPRPTFSPM